MEELFFKWAVPFLCGAAVSAAGAALLRLRALRGGLQCLLRAEILRCSEIYTERGRCPVYAKEALEKAYRSYHALGGNDVATALYKRVMDLPVAVPEDGG